MCLRALRAQGDLAAAQTLLWKAASRDGADAAHTEWHRTVTAELEAREVRPGAAAAILTVTNCVNEDVEVFWVADAHGMPAVGQSRSFGQDVVTARFEHASLGYDGVVPAAIGEKISTPRAIFATAPRSRPRRRRKARSLSRFCPWAVTAMAARLGAHRGVSW